MKIHEKLVSVFAATAIFSGCAPLQQAPLVYVSRVSAGIDLDVTPTAGVSANIGFKSTDAAYVPVAVSKEDDRERGIAHRIELLIARNTGREGNETINDPAVEKLLADYFSIKSLATQADRDLTKARDEVDKNERRLREIPIEVAAKRKELTDATAAQNALAAKAAPTAEEAAQASALGTKRAALAEQIASLGTENQVLVAKRAGLNSALEGAKATKERADKEVANREAEAKQKLRQYYSQQKQDAYSVYGSFNADTRASGGSDGTKGQVDMDVSLGRVFSTGVASQVLAEGIRNHLSRHAIARCIDATNKLASLTRPVKAGEAATEPVYSKNDLQTVLERCKSTTIDAR